MRLQVNIYRNGTGEKYTPFSHFDMSTQVIFNPQGGCARANVTLSTLKKGAGSNDEVHDHSDQIFYVIQGSMSVYAGGELKATVEEEEAILVQAGEPHSVINHRDLECIYFAVTVPPLERTH